jgi:succinate dehydrogenase / fumarate reductase iron-sulfur subunit
MRNYADGDEVWIEPWRARAFPVIRDLVVSRNAFDRIIAAGGYITARTGSAPDAHDMLVPKVAADLAMDAAECIACGACVAACPNASAMLFTSAKVQHLAALPQGQPERYTRVVDMIQQHDTELFGHCTNHGACQNACPKDIKVDYIARLNRDLRAARFRRDTDLA